MYFRPNHTKNETYTQFCDNYIEFRLVKTLGNSPEASKIGYGITVQIIRELKKVPIQKGPENRQTFSQNARFLDDSAH